MTHMQWSTDPAVTLADLPLVDHHCHGVMARPVDRAGFEALMNESDWPAGPGLTWFDSQVGLSMRRHCAEVLGLEPWTSAEEYLIRRFELGQDEVNVRFLEGSKIDTLLIETGFRGDALLTSTQMSDAANAPVFEVARLEKIAEDLLDAKTKPSHFIDQFAKKLHKLAPTVVGWKTIAAYRCGLDFNPERPSAAEVQTAVRAWRAECKQLGRTRLADPTIIRALMWAAVDTGMPIQFHVGYGDSDVELHRCNPLLLTRFLHLTRQSGARVMLLHCYPYQREAGYLAQVFPHVYCDVGLAVHNTGARSAAVIAESLELAPFHKMLFSSDAFGLPELYYLGTTLFRRGLARTLQTWMAHDECDEATATRIAHLVGHENAVRAYQLPERR